MRFDKRVLMVAIGPIVATLGFAAPSLAGDAGNGSGYGTQPGYSVAVGETPCAGHGSFWVFGKGFNFGNSTSGHVPDQGNAQNGNGADGQATGANNANLCGNPQGNP